MNNQINIHIIHKTQIAGLGYINQAPGLWRFVDTHDGQDSTRTVGPQYKTRQELLSDFDRYASSWGYGVSGNDEMKDYLVMVMVNAGDPFDENESAGLSHFDCKAENILHAKEQALAHGDSIKVLSVYEKVA